ncbi:HNH endonuclease [Pseudomonas sp. Marseille-P9899]|uniref:HNH endonuclease n=1 Tax=Pseudomonas sp. Marseille-P9899 TaxID=2730401 RepID=UPI001588FBBA|nr:HNH endonuclease signature motif containing protein [Pseudomonas sp. Marseille-P9899]
MRRVDRGPISAPACLEVPDKTGKTERDRARAHQSDPDPQKGTFSFTLYKHEDVRRALARLFHNKCAYCETFFSASAPVDIEHFRPKSSVSEDAAHPGYWWLAMSWDNLLPSCIDCNRRRKQYIPTISSSLEALYDTSETFHVGLQQTQTGKQDSFPIKDHTKRFVAESYGHDAEEPYLLDPARDDPRKHLRFHIDPASPVSLVLPTSESGQPSERGAVSIQTYGLNRLGLVQDRTRLLRRLEFLGELLLELGTVLDELETAPATLPEPTLANVLKRLKLLQERTLAEMQDMARPQAPYSEMVRTWIEQLMTRLT